MTPDQHLVMLQTEGMRLAAMPADALGAPVPTVPGWTLEQVVRHTGKVHRWVAATLAAGPDRLAQRQAKAQEELAAKRRELVPALGLAGALLL